MFKKLAKMISEIKTENDRNEVYCQIEQEFDHNKITVKEYELLDKLTEMIEVK